MQKTKKFWTITLTVSLLIYFAVILWAVFRSLELTDESLFLLKYETPFLYEKILPSFSCFGLIIHKLTAWIDPQICHFRLIRLMADIAGTIILYIGFWSWIKTFFRDKNLGIWSNTTVLLFLLLGTLASYIPYYQIISYNSLNNFFLYSSLGVIMLHISGRTHNSLPYIAGFLAGFNIFIKFPSSILFTFFAFILFKFDRGNSLKFITGLLTAVIAYFLLIESPEAFIKGINIALENIPSTYNEFWGNLAYTIFGAAVLILWYFKYTLSLLIAGLILNLFDLGKRKKVILKAVFTLSAAFLVYETTVNELYFIRLGVLVFIAVILMQVLIIQFRLLKNMHKSEEFKHIQLKSLPVAATILLLPLVLMVGSGSNPLYQCYIHLTPLFAFLIFLSILECNFFKKVKFQFILPFVFIVFIFLHLWNRLIFDPFKIPAPMPAQNYEVTSIPKLKNIKVDLKKRQFLTETQDLLLNAGFEKGDYLIGLDIPGIVYLFDGVSPGNVGWYIADTKHANFNCKGITRAKRCLKPHDSVYLLLPEENINRKDNAVKDFYSCLRENGFLNNYEVIGTTVNPYISSDWVTSDYKMILYKEKI